MRGHGTPGGRAAALLLVVALSAAGCAGGGAATGGAPTPESSPGKGVAVSPTSAADEVPFACGRLFRPPVGGVLALTGRFPSTVSVGERTLAGTVEATSRVAVRGVVAPRADVFLVRDGRVATVPTAQDAVGERWDLAPGAVRRLPGEVPLVSCAPAGEPVPAGAYEVYARVVVTPDDGAAVEYFGGPWPLEVR